MVQPRKAVKQLGLRANAARFSFSVDLEPTITEPLANDAIGPSQGPTWKPSQLVAILGIDISNAVNSPQFHDILLNCIVLDPKGRTECSG